MEVAVVAIVAMYVFAIAKCAQESQLLRLGNAPWICQYGHELAWGSRIATTIPWSPDIQAQCDKAAQQTEENWAEARKFRDTQTGIDMVTVLMCEPCALSMKVAAALLSEDVEEPTSGLGPCGPAAAEAQPNGLGPCGPAAAEESDELEEAYLAIALAASMRQQLGERLEAEMWHRIEVQLEVLGIVTKWAANEDRASIQRVMGCVSHAAQDRSRWLRQPSLWPMRVQV